MVDLRRWRSCGYLRAWWPMQARLQIRRIILSAPVFLLGEARFTAPCMNDGVRALSLPYFRLFWLRFARRLPVNINKVLVRQNGLLSLTCSSYVFSGRLVSFPSRSRVKVPLLERRVSNLNVSGVSKAKMESLSWMMSRSSSSSQKERWKPS